MILDNATVITMDPERRIFARGAVRVTEDRIRAVGPAADLARTDPDEERVDLSGRILLPGLIDGHVHLAQALIRGCADDVALLRWLTDRVWVLQGQYTPDDARLSAELCILEMLLSGTTAFVETLLVHRYGIDGMAEVVVRSGIRGALAKAIMDVPAYATQRDTMHPGMRETRDASLAEAVTLFERWHGRAAGRLQVWMGPRPVGSTSRETLAEVTRIARAHGMRVNIHFCEVREDVEHIRETTGLTPGAFAESVGLVGPDVLLIHAVWLGAEDIAVLARTGTHVVHNPASNTKLASGFAPIPAMRAAGVNVALGCDGGPSNNAYDMFREMKLAACIHKAVTLDPETLPAEAVLEMATINGARVLGMEDLLGSLEPGKKADLVVVNPSAPHCTPSPNPVSTLVYAAHGGDVESVMIDGAWVVRNRECLTLDRDRILSEARQRLPQILARAGLTIAPRWPVLGSPA